MLSGVNPLSAFIQVVACARSPTFTFNNDDVDFVVCLGALDCMENVARHGAADVVEFFWPVPAQPSYVRLFGVFSNSNNIGTGALSHFLVKSACILID